jgi:hypothetical protein
MASGNKSEQDPTPAPEPEDPYFANTSSEPGKLSPEPLGEIRYMGDALECNYYGTRMERTVWHPCFDPHVFAKAEKNADIEVKGRDKANRAKESHRAARPAAQRKYLEDQEKKHRREDRAADAMSGKG